MGKRQAERHKYWQGVIDEQRASGRSIRDFCRERNLGEHSFYWWRRAVRAEEPVAFALVEERKAASAEREPRMLELALEGGERLRIPCEEAALELVLRVVRALR